MKMQTFLIGGLLISALVLTLLLMVTPPARVAQADMVSTGSDYTLLATSPLVGGEESQVTVIDNRSQRMISYRLTGSQFQTIASEDLVRVFPAPARGR